MSRLNLTLNIYKSNHHFFPETELKSESDLLPPGAEPGTMPTDVEQATGLERFELLGKMQGIDVFDMKPLDASRMGTCNSIQLHSILGIPRVVISGCLWIKNLGKTVKRG